MVETIAILDFGSQYTQLIARRVRENRVYCEVLPHNVSPQRLRQMPRLKGIILSGGPSGVYEQEAPKCDGGLFDLDLPVLGICYGMQLGCKALGDGAEVAPATKREYGETVLEVLDKNSLFHGVHPRTTVWMSHGDRVER